LLKQNKVENIYFNILDGKIAGERQKPKALLDSSLNEFRSKRMIAEDWKEPTSEREVDRRNQLDEAMQLLGLMRVD
jgi:hypothetical protein